MAYIDNFGKEQTDKLFSKSLSTLQAKGLLNERSYSTTSNYFYGTNTAPSYLQQGPQIPAEQGPAIPGQTPGVIPGVGKLTPQYPQGSLVGPADPTVTQYPSQSNIGPYQNFTSDSNGNINPISNPSGGSTTTVGSGQQNSGYDPTGVFNPNISGGGGAVGGTGPTSALDAILQQGDGGRTTTPGSSITIGAASGIQPIVPAGPRSGALNPVDLGYQDQLTALTGSRKRGVLSTILGSGDPTSGSPLLIKPTLLGN